MLSRLKTAVYNHKQILFGSAVVVGGAVCAYKYLNKTWSKWQNGLTTPFMESIEKKAKEQHFRSTERTCRQTIISLSESLKLAIIKILDTEEIRNKIKQGSGNKIELWDELKIAVFTEIFTLLYSALMLVILLKIQLNILSGYMFKDKVNLPSNFQEYYLSLCQHFLVNGVKELILVIRENVTSVLNNVSLKEKMTLQDVERIFRSIETSLTEHSTDPVKNMAHYLLPPINSVSSGDTYNKLIEETFEILSNEDVTSTAYSCVRRAFSNTVDQIAAHYKSDSVNITKISLPFAKIIPIVHSLYKDSPENGTTDPWIEQFLIMDRINMLGASVYESYSNNG